MSAAVGTVKGVGLRLRRLEPSTTLLATVAVLSAGALTGVVVSRALGPAGRGMWARSYIPLTILAWAVTLGIDDALPVLGIRRPRATLAQASRLLRRLTLPATALAWAVVVVVGRQPVWAGLVIALYVPAYFIRRSGQGVLLLARALGAWNALRVVTPVSYAVLAGALLVGGISTVTGMLYAFTLAEWIAAGYALDRIRRLRIVDDEDAPSPMSDGEVVAFGAKLHLGSFPMVMNWRLDQLIMTQFASAADLGLYTLAASISFLPLGVGAAESESAVAGLSSARSVEGLERAVRRLYRRVFLFGGSASVLLLAAVPFALPVLYGREFADAVPATIVLLLGSVGLLAGLPAIVGLRAARQPGKIVVSEGLTAVCSLVLLPIVLPRWGISGAAWLSTVLYAVKSLLQYRFLAHSYRRPSPDWVMAGREGREPG